MNKRPKLTAVLILAGLSLIVIAGTKLSHMTRTRVISSTARFYTITQDASGRFHSRYITAPDLATNLGPWITNSGSGGSATNAITTIKTNGTAVSTAATSLDIIEGTNTVLRATNAAGVVTVQINSSGSGGGGAGTLPMNSNQFDTNSPVSVKAGALLTNITVRPAGSSGVAMTLRGLAGQDGNLLSVLDSDGNQIFGVVYDGGLTGTGANGPKFAAAGNIGQLWTATDTSGNGAWSNAPASSSNFITSAHGSVTVTNNLTVADEAYGAGWNGSTQVPTKNAVYDKIEGLSGVGEVNVTGEVSVTNGTRHGWTYDKSGVTNRLRSISAGYGAASTNESTNIVIAVDAAVIPSHTQLVNASNALVSLLVANDTTTSNGVVALELTRNAAVSNAVIGEIITASNNVYSTETTRNAAVSNAVVSLLVANDTTTSNGLVTLETTRNAAVSNAVISQIITASNNLYSTETTRNAAVSNALVTLSSNNVRVAAGSGGITVTPSGSGGVMTFTVSDDDAGSGSGGTNFPNVNLLVGATNGALAAGVRKAFYQQTNANWIFNLALSAPGSGYHVTLIETNSGATNYTTTIYTNSQAATVYDVGSKTNITGWSVPLGSVIISKLTWIGTLWVREEETVGMTLGTGPAMTWSTNGLVITPLLSSLLTNLVGSGISAGATNASAYIASSAGLGTNASFHGWMNIHSNALINGASNLVAGTDLATVLSNAPNTGATYVLGAGNYVVGASFAMSAGQTEGINIFSKTNFTLLGIPGRTFITVDAVPGVDNTNKLGELLLLTNSLNVKFYGLTFKGQSLSNWMAYTNNELSSLVLLHANRDVTIENCSFIDGWDHGLIDLAAAVGIVRHNTNVLVRGCYFQNFGQSRTNINLSYDGTALGPTGWDIDGCFFEDNLRAIEPYDDNVGGYPFTTLRIRNCVIKNTLEAGITTAGSTNMHSGIIENNLIYVVPGYSRRGFTTADYPGAGITVNGGQNVTIRGNRISGTSLGINLQQSAIHYGMVVSGNTIDTTGTGAAGDGVGIIIGSGSPYTSTFVRRALIERNSITQAETWGIQIHGVADSVFKDNFMHEPVQTGGFDAFRIYDAAASVNSNLLFTGNIIIDQGTVDTDAAFDVETANPKKIWLIDNYVVGPPAYANSAGTEMMWDNFQSNSWLTATSILGLNAAGVRTNLTVGPGLSVNSSMQLLLSSVLTNLVGTVGNNVTNENSTALQINSGTLTLSPGSVSNLVNNTSINFNPGNIVSNVGSTKGLVWTNYVQTVSNFVFSFNTNYVELKNQTNVVFTNIVEEATAVRGNIEVHIHNTTGVTMGLVWPAYGAQHGYFFQTNANNAILSSTSLASGQHGIASLSCFGTNIFATFTTWP